MEIYQQKVKWHWNVFGGSPPLLMTNIVFEVPLWRRIITRIFLGSVWTREQ